MRVEEWYIEQLYKEASVMRVEEWYIEQLL